MKVPRGVELDDDEGVLGDGVGEIGGVEGEDVLHVVVGEGGGEEEEKEEGEEGNPSSHGRIWHTAGWRRWVFWCCSR